MDQRSLLDQIFDVLNAASFTAIGVAVIMLVAAALLIATTIRLSAFSRRRELGIMRLVGASNRFIQTPFVLEGVLAGLIGSLLAGAAVLAIVQFFVQGYLAETLSFTFVDLGDAWLVVPLLILVGGWRSPRSRPASPSGDTCGCRRRVSIRSLRSLLDQRGGEEALAPRPAGGEEALAPRPAGVE